MFYLDRIVIFLIEHFVHDTGDEGGFGRRSGQAGRAALFRRQEAELGGGRRDLPQEMPAARGLLRPVELEEGRLVVAHAAASQFRVGVGAGHARVVEGSAAAATRVQKIAWPCFDHDALQSGARSGCAKENEGGLRHTRQLLISSCSTSSGVNLKSCTFRRMRIFFLSS